MRSARYNGTLVQAWPRLAGHEPVPAIYGPSGDWKREAADPTYSLDAARRGLLERSPTRVVLLAQSA